MGCDGGTIPRRDELVRTKKKPEKADKNAETVAKWKHCAISQDPLHKPIVACELGRLYNKEAVLEHLLNKNKASSSEVGSHIQKLSDVKELNLTEKNGFQAKSDQKGGEYVDFHDSRFICPVTGLDMNGKQRFYFIWNCGCVLSERAIKEVKSETCHKCGKPLNHNDVIVINGTEDEVAALKDKMDDRRKQAKLAKKKKKATTNTGPCEKKIKIESEEASSSSGSCIQQSKVLNDQVKTEAPESVGTPNLANGTAHGGKSENGKIPPKRVELPEKAKKTYSIAKDPTATAAYKSLFTSHKSAQKQEKAHWVTHNPLYF